MNDQDYIKLADSYLVMKEPSDKAIIMFAKEIEARVLAEVVRIESLYGWKGVVDMINDR